MFVYPSPPREMLKHFSPLCVRRVLACKTDMLTHPPHMHTRDTRTRFYPVEGHCIASIWPLFLRPKPSLKAFIQGPTCTHTQPHLLLPTSPSSLPIGVLCFESPTFYISVVCLPPCCLCFDFAIKENNRVFLCFFMFLHVRPSVTIVFRFWVLKNCLFFSYIPFPCFPSLNNRPRLCKRYTLKKLWVFLILNSGGCTNVTKWTRTFSELEMDKWNTEVS